MSSYEICSIIISALSAVATFLAVCVALWQSKMQYKIKLEIVYRNNVEIPNDEGNYDECVEFTIFNLNHRKVAVYGISIGSKNKFLLPTMTDMQLFENPKILDAVETASIAVKRTDLFFCIKDLIKKNKNLGQRKIVFTIEDTEGRKFYCKMKHTYNDYLLWSTGKIDLLTKLN